MKPPTLPEIRDLLDELYYEIDNRGGPSDSEGAVFHRAHETMRWLLEQYLRRGTHVSP